MLQATMTADWLSFCHLTRGIRVSTTPGNTGNTGNLLEFEIPPGNTGNLLDFC